jgi:hypothetical protein
MFVYSTGFSTKRTGNYINFSPSQSHIQLFISLQVLRVTTILGVLKNQRNSSLLVLCLRIIIYSCNCFVIPHVSRSTFFLKRSEFIFYPPSKGLCLIPTQNALQMTILYILVMGVWNNVWWIRVSELK